MPLRFSLVASGHLLALCVLVMLFSRARSSVRSERVPRIPFCVFAAGWCVVSAVRAFDLPDTYETWAYLAGMALAAGGSHSLALCSDGTLAAWGWNTSGQLGNGFTADSLTPVAVDTTGALAGKKRH